MVSLVCAEQTFWPWFHCLFATMHC